MVNATLSWPAAIVGVDTADGVAGGGASSLATRVPQELGASVYSWIVHIVIWSSGSTLV